MFLELDISTAKFQNIFKICCVPWYSHLSKYLFLYLLVLCVNFYVKLLYFAPTWSISCFQPISVAIFVAIAMVKVKLILDSYTLVIVLIN